MRAKVVFVAFRGVFCQYFEKLRTIIWTNTHSDFSAAHSCTYLPVELRLTTKMFWSVTVCHSLSSDVGKDGNAILSTIKQVKESLSDFWRVLDWLFLKMAALRFSETPESKHMHIVTPISVNHQQNRQENLKTFMHVDVKNGKVSHRCMQVGSTLFTELHVHRPNFLRVHSFTLTCWRHKLETLSTNNLFFCFFANLP